jgi:hypothetical protein
MINTIARGVTKLNHNGSNTFSKPNSMIVLFFLRVFERIVETNYDMSCHV